MHPLLDLDIVDTIRELGELRSNGYFIHDLLNIFAKQSDLTTRELSAAIGNTDFTQVRYLAHRLKGSAANIGAKELSMRAAAIEALVKVPCCDVAAVAAAIQSVEALRCESLAALTDYLQQEGT